MVFDARCMRAECPKSDRCVFTHTSVPKRVLGEIFFPECFLVVLNTEERKNNAQPLFCALVAETEEDNHNVHFGTCQMVQTLAAINRKLLFVCKSISGN